MKDLSINNIIISDGNSEFSRDQIKADSKLTQLVNTITAFGGFPTLIEQINKEGGLLYITVASNHESGKAELRNVSKELYAEYLKITE